MTQRNASSDMPQSRARDNETPVFEALLTPHRSLGRNGFVVLISIVTAMTVAHSFVFVVAGAWPVAAFSASTWC